MRTIIVVGVFIFTTRFIYSQYDRISFSKITTSDGLSNNWVRDIYQDQKGFMWFGTRDGLNRYDGYTCKIYRPGYFKDITLGDIAVNTMLEVDGWLWVGTDIGLFVYDAPEDKLVPLPTPKQLSVTCILQDSRQQVWLGTHAGLYRYTIRDSTWNHYVNNPNDSKSISNGYITRLFMDSESDLWIGTQNGLNLYRDSSDSFISYFFADPADIGLENDVMAIAKDNKNRIWLGSTRKGLYVLVQDEDGNARFKKVLPGAILDLMIDRQNILWIARGGNLGLERMHLNDFSLEKDPATEHYALNRADPASLSDNSVFCLYQDHLNDIWIGTFEGGVNYYSPRAKKFKIVRETYDNHESIRSNLVNSFFEEKDFFWIGTEGGLDRLNKNTGKYSHYEYDLSNPSSIGGNPVYAILKDTKGNLWVGTWAGGLNLFDYETETFKRFLADKKPGSLSNSSIFSIYEDSRENLWIGTIGGGLDRFDYSTETFIHYLHDDNDRSSLDNNYVHNIIETSRGKLYIATSNSLEQYNYESDNFIHYPHFVLDSATHAGEIISIFEDSRKNLWIATNAGLEIFDEKWNIFIPYILDRSKLHGTIQSILEDDHRNLWISTNKGISKIERGIFTPQPAILVDFTVEDGIAGNESIKRSAYKNKDGILFFGSSTGYTYFHPDSILLNTIVPNVVITGFNTLSSTPDENVKYATIAQNIETLDRLELSYRNSDFIIQYSALNFLNSVKNQYRYKLKGYDKNWIDAGNQRATTYTNLNPGKYTFLVMGSNNDLKWSLQPKNLEIVIHPPWWHTRMFEILIFLILVSALYSFYRIRISLLKKQKELLEEKVKERTHELNEKNTLLEERTEEITLQNVELSQHRNHLEKLIDERTRELKAAKIKAEQSDRLKSAFLANMSHEIRTPMNAIVGFTSLLGEKYVNDEERIKFIDIITKSSKALLILINEILDISMIETDQLKLYINTFDVNEILRELESYYQINNHKDLEITFIQEGVRKGDLMLKNDPVRFRQILTNLINNAVKYTESGYVWFGYEILDDHVRFFVSDSGIGIDPVHFDKIFNHFYKVDTGYDKLYRGTGLGLSLCKRLVYHMGGEIWVESAPQSGSVFYFTLPFEKLAQTSEKEEYSPLEFDKYAGNTIIVAEDEPDNFQLIKSILKPYITNIIWAKNGREVIDYLEKERFSSTFLVLMDIKMPVLDGYEATKIIKSKTNAIPVIALTAYAQVNDREKIMAEKFDDYIAKPFKSETLLRILAKHMKK